MRGITVYFEISFAISLLTASDDRTKKSAEKYIADGQFAKGSMLPKVEACIDFVKGNPNKKAIIGSLDKAADAIKGT